MPPRCGSPRWTRPPVRERIPDRVESPDRLGMLAETEGQDGRSEPERMETAPPRPCHDGRASNGGADAVTEPFDLDRFVQAQAPVMTQVRRELAEGQKRSHWMWFVFPQLRGLGHSAMAQRYGIASLAEARAYLDHPVLGPRLVECTDMVNRVEGRSAHQILGSPDDLKFHSAMTLFAAARPEEPAFRVALDKYFAGLRDRQTLERLPGGGAP